MFSFHLRITVSQITPSAILEGGEKWVEEEMWLKITIKRSFNLPEEKKFQTCLNKLLGGDLYLDDAIDEHKVVFQRDPMLGNRLVQSRHSQVRHVRLQGTTG